MKITRNVILDLLPLYLADEVSADTKTLVEDYLATDPELANAAKKLTPIEKPQLIPAALSRDAEVKAFQKARRQQLLFILIFAGVLSIFLVITLLMFFISPT